MLQSKVIYRRNSMAIYTVQCGFIDTDGSISVASRDFEAADKSDAIAAISSLSKKGIVKSAFQVN
jgi:hypothetical protein